MFPESPRTWVRSISKLTPTKVAHFQKFISDFHGKCLVKEPVRGKGPGEFKRLRVQCPLPEVRRKQLAGFTETKSRPGHLRLFRQGNQFLRPNDGVWLIIKK